MQKIVEENNIDISFDDEIFDGIIPKENTDTALSSDATATHYWLYAAGDGSANWENDYAEGIMAIGWSDLGDLMEYSSKEEMRAKMKEVYGDTGSYKNQVLATWQFANELKPGDVVFVKKAEGRSSVAGWSKANTFLTLNAVNMPIPERFAGQIRASGNYQIRVQSKR